MHSLLLRLLKIRRLSVSHSYLNSVHPAICPFCPFRMCIYLRSTCVLTAASTGYKRRSRKKINLYKTDSRALLGLSFALYVFSLSLCVMELCFWLCPKTNHSFICCTPSPPGW